METHNESRLGKRSRKSSATDARPAARTKPRWLRVVAIGGGTGLPAVLQGLSAASLAYGGFVTNHLTSIVTVTDDGGSSGSLRRRFGILRPGDIRNCLAALAKHPSVMTQFLQHRFSGDDEFSGHAVGNPLLLALTQMSGDFASAVERLGEILAVRGRVLPSTRENISLRAQLDGGEVVDVETAIAARRMPIRRLWLERQVQPLPEAIDALLHADAIVVGPGSLYTSVPPNLLVDGIVPAIVRAHALRIYVANLIPSRARPTISPSTTPYA